MEQCANEPIIIKLKEHAGKFLPVTDSSRTEIEPVGSVSEESTKSRTKSSTKPPSKIDIYKQLDADKLVDSYGTYGRYQLFGYFLCQSLNFFYAASLYVMSYVQINPTIDCRAGSKSVSVDESCWIKEGSFKGEQCGIDNRTTISLTDSRPVTSIFMEFDLTCSHYIWKEAGLAIFTVGAMTTVPFLAGLADKFGRRPVILGAVTVAFICNVAAAFAPNFWVFLALRFLVGSASDTYLSVSSIATCEYTSTNFRAWITLAYTVLWVLGMFWIGILSLFVSHWRWFYLAHTVPALYCILLFFCLPESPHWLLHHQKFRRIELYIENANRWNKCEVDLSKCLLDKKRTETKHESLSDILRSPTMIKYLLINGLIQFTMSLYYFAISFMSVDLSEDRFTAFMLSGLVEIPGGLIVIPLMLYFGRRWIVSLSLFGQAALIIAAPFGTMLMDASWVPTFFMLAGKLVNSITYGIHPVYASEMVPTTVRSLSFSIVNIPQSLGIIAAPYFKHLANFGPYWARFVVVGVFCILSGLLVLQLPETKDCPMPPDIESLSNSGDCSDVDEDDVFSSFSSARKASTKRLLEDSD